MRSLTRVYRPVEPPPLSLASGIEQRQASFRNGGQATGGAGGPQTGLSILKGENKRLSTTDGSLAVSVPANPQIQADLLDRELQASSLAAAGMLADTVTTTQAQGLQAPPPLVASAPQPPGSAASAATMPAPTVGATTELDSINWNMMDIGAVHLDDIDMDFATLFDPENEEANMRTEGSGWPSASSNAKHPGAP